MLINADRGFRSFARLIPVLIALLALTACVDVAVESAFSADGSARHSITTTVDPALLDDELVGGELDFDEIQAAAEDAGFQVEQINETTRAGIRIIRETDDSSDLGGDLNRLFSALDPEAPPIEGFSGYFREREAGFGRDAWEFELVIDAGELFQPDPDEFDIDAQMAMLQQLLNLTYTVSMPGEITDHNGTEIGRGRVEWTIPMQGSASFRAESEDESSFPLLLVVGIAIGALALLLVIVGAIMLMRGNQPRLAETRTDTGEGRDMTVDKGTWQGERSD